MIENSLGITFVKLILKIEFIKKMQIEIASQKKRHEIFAQFYKGFIQFLKDKDQYYLQNKNNKNFALRAIKESANTLIYEFEKLYPNAKCPSKSSVYRMFENQYLNLSNKMLTFKSLGKNRQSTTALEKAIPKKRIGKDISQRSQAYNDRTSLHSWELDTIQGKRTDLLIVFSLMNRRSGEHYLLIIERTSQAMLDALKYLIKNQKIRIDSITMDNGSENYKLDQLHDVELYHCKPYNSGQKGSIESAHRIFRKFIPKGKSFNNLTMRDIFAIVKRVNDFPSYNKEFGKLMSPNDFKKFDQVFAN